MAPGSQQHKVSAARRREKRPACLAKKFNTPTVHEKQQKESLGLFIVED